MNASARRPRPAPGLRGGAEQPAPMLVEPPSTAHQVAAAVARWRARLAARAGDSSLADMNVLGDATLDLSAAHPSGVAQLFAGRPTQLSNLFRESSALPAARRRARAVGLRATEHAERYGVAPTYLAIGVATWTEDAAADLASGDVAALARIAGGTGAALDADLPDAPQSARRRVKMRAPVLLRPIRLLARGSGESDYELTLETSAELNPVLARALRARGALLDPVALARGAFASGGFDPRSVTERVHALGSAVLADFELTEKLVVGIFVHPGQVLVDDLDELSGLEYHELLVSLATADEVQQAPTAEPRTDDEGAGDDPAREDQARDDPAQPGSVYQGVADEARIAVLPEPPSGDVDPAQERGVGDLDRAQRQVLDAVAAGSHVFVDAPAGADVAGTVCAVIADAAASGRNVLYVPGHRRVAQAVIGRMAELGLSDLVLDVPPEPGWRAAISLRLLGAMTLEAVHPDARAHGRLRADLLDARRRLSGYVDALHEVREPWGVSAYDALQALARLTAERPAPANRVRLTHATTVRTGAIGLDDVTHRLVRACELGAFTLRPAATPWFGATLTTPDDAQAAYARTERLADDLLPRLRRQVDQVVNVSGLTEPASVRAWGAQLEMLDGVRETLDVFQPIIFERTAADLVAATATRQWRAAHGVQMGLLQRRRLQRQAKDMVRPGTRVPDLHAALISARTQRKVWHESCPGGGWPRLPEGLDDIRRTFDEVAADLGALEPVLAATPNGGKLMDAPLAVLVERIEALMGDRAALETLPERTALVQSLADDGFGELVEDLQARRVGVAVVGPEVELAWWSSVFELILRSESMLATYDGAELEALAVTFRELDREQVAGLGPMALATAIDHLTQAMRTAPEDTENLFAELLEGRFPGLRESVDRYPQLIRRLRPATIATPTLVPYLLPPARTVDLVVLDSVQHLPIEMLVPAIARGRQIVVVGDPRCASGTAVAQLSDVLPTIHLRAQVSSLDPQFVDFLARHGYDEVLRPAPVPRPRTLIGFDVVAGTGMPDQDSGAVLTTQAEVDRVVELAITHALTHPEESLAIVTLTHAHSERLREALLSEVRHNPALAGFFDPARHEPVVIADMSAVAGLSRDAVILSVGFGRTPHGRVLHRFGPLSGPSGGAMLLDALGVTRGRLHVVSCFATEDLDPARLRSRGARMLNDLLDFAARRSSEGAVSPLVGGVDSELNPDRLVIDLAERLWRAGLTVETDYGVAGGARIPLVVGHPEFPDRMLVAVLTDDDDYVAEKSVRVRDRQVAEELEGLGWTVVPVWSAAVFLDPVKEATRIRQIVLGLADRLAADPMTAAVPVVTPPAAMDEVEPAEIDPASLWVDASAQPGTVSAAMPEAALGAADQPDSAEPVAAAPQAVARPQRPDVEPGLPISAYGDNELDDLLRWIRADGIERSAEQLAGALRAELGVVRRSNRVDTAVGAAVRRALG
ncbi:MAG: hypothetical protein ACTMIR_10540 [Cellulomonadaceae bacterium]